VEDEMIILKLMLGKLTVLILNRLNLVTIGS
jgi:hypothetical protein